MAKITIDDFQIEVPEGTTILNAAYMIGGDLVPPAMCCYSSLKGSGGYCRTRCGGIAALGGVCEEYATRPEGIRKVRHYYRLNQLETA